MNKQAGGNLLTIGLELVSKITQLQIFLACFFAAAIEYILSIQVAKMPSSWALAFINAFRIPRKRPHKLLDKLKLQ